MGRTYRNNDNMRKKAKDFRRYRKSKRSLAFDKPNKDKSDKKGSQNFADDFSVFN